LRNRNIGFVFQTFYLMARYRALENVMLPLLYRGLPRSERRERAVEALKRVGLETRMSHRPGELSGGECQWVAIARAIVNQPEFILADEPTGNLDSYTGEEIINLFARLNKETATTVVLVTHDQKLAQFCTRRFIMKDGQIYHEN
jgi:putative ABC transport system ATP-binding protein